MAGRHGNLRNRKGINMCINDRSEIVDFVEDVMQERTIELIVKKIQKKKHSEVESILQSNGFSTVEHLARVIFNIYKDKRGKGA